ncbi:Tubby-like F-box protein 2 [Apostasia shenzhenica]|uniref:Tubby-like F-box protein 2 n=1 Tax=Apostasia shenzhenica TaxID=1088818 RepID=A0A2I0B7V4_9ASPA|nr:Tubby-like F-box protein 2 [Apostasia shenzhenica]
MSFKSSIRDLKEARAASTSAAAYSTSYQSPPCLLPHHRPMAEQETHEEGRPQMSKWANLPPELLLDILKRVESGQVSWPGRRNVVSCASVCRTWREITKEVVKPPEKSGRLTFPISLKQPGPRDFPIQCFIRRERAISTYRLYLGLSPGEFSILALLEKNDKLLLAARKSRRAASTDFVISLGSKEFSRASCSYVGKLRQVFDFSAEYKH